MEPWGALRVLASVRVREIVAPELPRERVRFAADWGGQDLVRSRGLPRRPLCATCACGEILLLLSDGAWTPLPLARLRSIVARAALRPLAELPDAILAEASRTGRADDMTVVVARRG